MKGVVVEEAVQLGLGALGGVHHPQEPAEGSHQDVLNPRGHGVLNEVGSDPAGVDREHADARAFEAVGELARVDDDRDQRSDREAKKHYATL